LQTVKLTQFADKRHFILSRESKSSEGQKKRWKNSQWGQRKCGKVEPLFGETFPIGGGNLRGLRISTDASFPSGRARLAHGCLWCPLAFSPTNSAEDPKILTGSGK